MAAAAAAAATAPGDEQGRRAATRNGRDLGPVLFLGRYRRRLLPSRTRPITWGEGRGRGGDQKEGGEVLVLMIITYAICSLAIALLLLLLLYDNIISAAPEGTEAYSLL